MASVDFGCVSFSTIGRIRRGESSPSVHIAGILTDALNTAASARHGVNPGYTLGELFGSEPLPALPKRPETAQTGREEGAAA